MRNDLLLLADSRLPAGGHAHSGGLEPAAASGAVRTVADLADFLHGRLHTAGLAAAALAAAACRHAGNGPDPASWLVLDAEADARTPSPAQRAASRAQGKALLRAARGTWPSPVLDALGDAHRARRTPDGRGPHHPVVLGVTAFAADGSPHDAAAIAAYTAVSGSASAAVRLLGLDPLGVHRALADLSAAVDAVAREAAGHAEDAWADLPAPSAPVLDGWAELHLLADLRLFES